MGNDSFCKRVRAFWKYVDACRWEDAAGLLADDCCVSWPCTGEHFSKQAFLEVNRRYPGTWDIIVESCMEVPGGAVSVVRVQSPDTDEAHYAVSFFTAAGNLIADIREYWSAVEKPPQWRRRD